MNTDLPGHPFSHDPFRSFWQAGFEGADHLNGSGFALCMKTQTDHLAQAGADYARLSSLGLTTVRESLGWRQADQCGQYDFSIVDTLERNARSAGVQILWTLCHYGIPADEDFFSSTFVARFTRYCRAFARHLLRHHSCATPRVYTPINEISFLSWAVCETGLFHPHPGDRPHDGYALKRRLVEAVIAATNAIREEDPEARILNVDPLVFVVPDHNGLQHAAHARNELQFQAWDMLCGRSEPQLGGSPAHLDLVGVNYYPSNQWQLESSQTLAWPSDARRKSLSLLLQDLWHRYSRPLVISETSHVGNQRGEWLLHVACETSAAISAGVPVLGICLYPALNRPDWENPAEWHDSGLWQVDPIDMRRSLDLRYAQALQGARSFINPSPQHDQEYAVMKTSPIETLIVFSHLRWDFVYQRPQHLLSRLGRSLNIVFVEEPTQGEAALLPSHPVAGVTVLRASLPDGGHGYSDDVMENLSGLLGAYLADNDIANYGVWFYTPMALPLLRALDPRVVIYDCMDELSGFKNAPPQLMAREATLLRIASAVFTGGPSLYEAKRDRNDAVFCFPSSVEAAHFSQARDQPRPDAMYDDIAHPRLGYYGVIDERLDLELIESMARARPDWQLCIVGPVVKIDPAALPLAANLHYFPQQPYEALPGSLAAWDVCLLPFALNDATRFISPTKTLEYMCAEKPVVSTRITDVTVLYQDGVRIADSHAGFIDECARALEESEDERHVRALKQNALVARTSWDQTADAMLEILEAAAASGLTPVATEYLQDRQVVRMEDRLRPHAKDRETPCLIIGAGPTGLSASMHYGAGSVLVEANETVGGWCRSIEDKGFTFDYAGHIMFSNDAYVLQLYDKLLGSNLHWQDREAWVYSKQVYTRYPFQGALYGLPTEVLKECIVGAIEARFGSLNATTTPSMQATPAANDAANDSNGVVHKDCCADGTAVATEGDVKDASTSLVSDIASKRQPHNFEEFIYQVWGAGVAKHFAVPYNTKLWTVPLQEMETSWLGGRVPLPNLDEMIEGALRPVSAPVGPNARFGYPLRGGFAALMEGFLPLLQGELVLGRRMVSLQPNSRMATLDDGSRISYETLISTIPLPELIRIIGSEAPEYIHRAAAALKHVSVKCVNLGIGRPDLTDKHWIYFPEDTVFHRIFVQGNASPHNNPPDGFGLTCEITYSPTKPLPCDGQELIERCVRECIDVGIFTADDRVVTANIVDMPYAYVVYDHARQENVSRIRSWLTGKGIILAGRYSEWEYYNSDHAFLAGKRAAEAAMELDDTGTH